MSEELLDYYESKMESMYAASDVGGQTVEYQFLDDALDLLANAGEFDDYSLSTDCRNSSGRWLANGYAYDENNFALTLFVSHIAAKKEPEVLQRKTIESLLKKVENFVKLSLWEENLETHIEPTGSCYQIARFVRENWNEISHLRLVLISNEPASERMRQINQEPINGKEVSFSLWDLRRLFELETSRNEREEMIVDFSSTPLPCLVARDNGEAEKSILTVMSGETLCSLYSEWGSRLLEQNVRSFLQNRGKVNQGIRKTILEAPERFFAYNNGLTTTAEGATIVESAVGPVITELKNLQIVNGGQTTASIYSAFKKDNADLSQISVQMKLTVASDEESSDLIPKIARFANSQNKVSDADLFSNHEYHIRIENFSRRVWVPQRADQASQTHWYYERARGQYLNDQAYLTPAKKREFQAINPNAQKLTKTDLAKIMNSWASKPHIVSTGAQKNFGIFAEEVSKEWDKDSKAFNEEYFKEVVWKSWVFRAFEKKVLKADWYQQYRANVVTYSIARLSKALVDQGKEIDTEVMWRSQKVPDVLIELLMTLGEKVTDLLLAEDRRISNPSEYAKRKFFWDIVEVIPCDISTISGLLIGGNEAKNRKKEAKETQKIDDGFEALAKVLQTDSATWERLTACLEDDGRMSPAIKRLIDRAKVQRITSDRDALTLCTMLAEYSDHLS